jgi:hypothetical protein
MFRIIVVIVVLWFALAAPARAQSINRPEDSNAYTQEDSHPLKILGYALAPVGFLLEWTVARPLHYLATDSFVAPVLGGDEKESPAPLVPRAEIPHRSYSNLGPQTQLRDLQERPAEAPPVVSQPPPSSGRSVAKPAEPAPQPDSSSEGRQPVLH